MFSYSPSFSIIFIIFIGFTSADLIFDCPEEWDTFVDHCYKFVMFPEVNHDDARVACGFDGASLVGVNSREEHNFISSWLIQRDLARMEYYTSGFIRNIWTGDAVWESDGTLMPPDLSYWLSEDDRNKTGQYVVYKYGVTQYAWSRVDGLTKHPYICEIKREESYRIIGDKRGFDYGLNTSDPNAVPYGPHFILEPSDVIEAGNSPSVSIECVARSNPLSTYEIYHSEENDTLITSDTDNRYTITNGKLTITSPVEDDAGQYFCKATNRYGTILGIHMKYSFGFLGEFSNIEREPVRVHLHSYGVMDCGAPNHRPAVAYNWIKGTGFNFINTQLNAHIFISYNGKLYFSEVASSDEDNYRCVVKLISEGDAALGNNQPPSRISLNIPLIVTHSLPVDWGPEIGDDFITVYPRQPKRGQRVRMECLAFGTLPITYNWSRKDGFPISASSSVDDHNRILYIDNVQLEDATTYVCHASRGSGGNDEKSHYLSVESKPYFIFPLQDQHVDQGSQLTWRCEAKALPKQEYSWYKNGSPLTPGVDIEIMGNILVIRNLDAVRHDGMYQCRAVNVHGDAYSSAQLRVLSFTPSFAKHPVEMNIVGTVGGNVTIVCSPEAAPFPTFTWLKNGANMGLADGDTTSRVRKMRNGNLLITNIVVSDAGFYTCVAENINGRSDSSGTMKVVTGTTITRPPSDTRVVTNNTAFLACETSHNNEKDIIITWLFNGVAISLTDQHYSMSTQGGINGLYIRQALYRHGGLYSCLAKTPFDSDERSATLTVLGPPAEPAGVYVDSTKITSTSMTLWWSSSYVRSIDYYTIQAFSHLDEKWKTVLERIYEGDTHVDGKVHRRAIVNGLRPGTSYNFKVIPVNSYGFGTPSLPSKSYSTPPGPPEIPPANITNGPGRVGDLDIIWDPLPRADHGGEGIGYNVYWRRYGTSSRFLKGIVEGNFGQYVETVGSDNYYLPYEVIVQAFNENGVGPNSTIHTIYSAEDLPVGMPLQVMMYRHNATCMNVSWVPVPNNREFMKGKIVGYQINYWEVNQTNARVVSARHMGQSSGNIIIGLQPFTMYEVDVQVYNTAGLGPRSELYRQRTWSHPPLLYPTEVHVFSHGPDSALIKWRGVSTGIIEEPLRGYKVRYWVATDDIRTAYDFTAGVHTSEAVIYGVEPGKLYKLRVFGFSEGGDGKMSPDVYFTLGGSVRIDHETSEIIAASSTFQLSFSMLFAIMFVHFYVRL